jgi:acetolactate synthase-1/2/3 large subunit
MSKLTGAELVVRALEDEKVPFAFGIPGAQNLELYDVLDRAEKVRPILVTDEQCASFMADGVSRASGDLGCVNLVPGAGLTHALSGIAEAYMDGIPMLVLASGIRSDIGKAFQLHDIDQLAVARPVTKAQIHVVEGERIYHSIRQACGIARTPPAGPVIVELPAELLVFRHVAPPRVAAEAQPPPAGPSKSQLARVLDALARSRQPLLYLGLGSSGAGPGLVALAERLEAPVSTTFQGKGVFPECHPLWLWCGFGPAAPPFVQSIARNCDLTLAIGVRFAEVATGSYGLEPPRPLIHVDIDKTVFDRNCLADIAIEADAEAFVASLLESLPQAQSNEGLRAAILKGHEKVRADWAAPRAERGVAPPKLFAALQEVYGPEAVFAADSGNGLFEAVECLRIDRPRAFLAPVDFSCMGYALPAALAAALASPGRPAVALVGDGAFLMTGLELITAAQLGIAVTVIVLRDRELAQIAQFQEIAFAHKTASELADFDLLKLCEGCGVKHIGLTQEEDLHGALMAARETQESGRPVVVEVAIDSSKKTYFTRGVVRTNFGRLPWADRLRFVARAVARRLPGRV